MKLGASEFDMIGCFDRAYSAASLARNEEDSNDCLLSKTQIVPRCCPTEPDVTCTFCPDGITIDGEDNVAQCESHTKEASVFEEGSELCETAKAFTEDFCCGSFFDDLDPAAPPTEGTCDICPGGLSIREGATLTSMDGSTTFSGILGIQTECEWAISNPWTESRVPLTEYTFSSDSCAKATLNFRPVCCPAEPENPCRICPDGFEVEDEDDIASCEMSAQAHANVEEDSDACELAKSQIPFCCSSNAVEEMADDYPRVVQEN